jgi:hypothetical protein
MHFSQYSIVKGSTTGAVVREEKLEKKRSGVSGGGGVSDLTESSAATVGKRSIGPKGSYSNNSIGIVDFKTNRSRGIILRFLTGVNSPNRVPSGAHISTGSLSWFSFFAQSSSAINIDMILQVDRYVCICNKLPDANLLVAFGSQTLTSETASSVSFKKTSSSEPSSDACFRSESSVPHVIRRP